MAGQQRTLKQLLAGIPGLRLPAGKLSEGDGEHLLVVSRLTDVFGADNPYQYLDKDTVHDKCLELLHNCHRHRQMMVLSGCMELDF